MDENELPIDVGRPERPVSPPLGVFINEKVYVWDERVDKTSRTLKKIRDRITNVVNAIFFIVAIASFLIFAIGAIVGGFVGRLVDVDFWMEPNWYLFTFFLSIFCVLFVMYRMTEAAREKVVVPEKPYESETPVISDASGSGQKRVNIAKVFDLSAMKATEEAFSIAERFSNPSVEPLHLFIGCLATDPIAIVFGRLGISFETVKGPLGRRLAEQPRTGHPAFTETGTEALLTAFISAYEQGNKKVSSLDIFQEAYNRDEFLKELMYDQKVDEVRFKNVIEWVRINERLRERYETFRKAALRKPVGAMNRSMTSVVTPMLDSVSEDLTTSAVYGRLPFLVGRDREIEEVFRVIEGGGQSAILVGPTGVGKDAIMAGIAERMVEEKVPQILEDKRFVRVSIPHLVSGASPAEAQERLIMVLNDVVRSGNIILAISNIEQMTGMSSGGEQSIDLSAVLVDYLERSNTFVIASTTPEAYTSAVERSVLGRVFQKVMIDEPGINESIHILESKIGSIEHQNEVIFSFDALERCVTLTDRFMHETFLPQKAIEIAKEVALHAKKTKGANTLVTGEDVGEIVSSKTRVPVTQVASDEKEKLLNMEERLHKRVIGQDEAVKSVSAALRRARAELSSGTRPIANFLFLGPTGVGKTELAKSVAEAYFGGETQMLRFDMSEYQDKSGIYQLIGTPGSKEGGLLTEAVRQNPFSIVLLDELEKAHPDILNIFLQVMDDGRLTDAAGRTIDFTNTIIVATSNAGSQFIQDEVSEGTDISQIKNQLLESGLKEYYRPEFLNRFDGVIVFKPLTMDEVTQIAYMMMGKVAEKLEPKGIQFRATDEAVAEIAEKGYDPKYGARPLRRVVQEEVDNAIANALLEGKAGRRDTMVLMPGGKIEIEKAEEL